MVVNTHPIFSVTTDDIGRPMSAQWAGMDTPRHGYIAGISNLEGYVFIRYIDAEYTTLEDLYNCRWGHVSGW